MKTEAKGALRALAGLSVILFLSSRLALAQSGAMPQAGKTTDEVFKNIQVLKGIPSDQLLPTMQFVAAALGQRCTFCHVEDAFDKDDKKEKQTARKMMQMVLAINKDDFKGRVTVSCYTCHRGNQDPVGTPVISDTDIRPERPRAGGPGGPGGERPQGPTADQLLDKYLQAVGGVDALAKITSRAAKGNVLAADGGKTPVEIYGKGTEQRIVIMHAAQGDTISGYDGNAGWTSNPERGPRDMSAADLEAAKLEDGLYLATHVRQIYSRWRAGRPEKIGGRDTTVLNGSAPGHLPVRLYFDAQSGLLLRMIHFIETPLGRLPGQVDYADYRDQDGVKVPYRLILGRPSGRTTIQFDLVQDNLPVEDSKFAKPAAPARP